MQYLIEFMKKRWKTLTFTLFLLLGQVVGTLIIPYLIAKIVDNGILAGDMQMIFTIGLQMLLVTLIATGVAILGSYYSAELAAAFGRDMRNAIFVKSQEVSTDQFDQIGVSSMITRTTSDISSLQQTLGMILQMVVPAPLIIAASIIMTAQISLPLTLIPLSCILIFMLMVYFVFKKSEPISRLIQVKMDKINQLVRESVTGIRVIRAFDNGIYEQKRSDDSFADYAANMIRLNKLFATLNPGVWLTMGLSMAAIVWFGGIFSAKGEMQIGEITAVIEYTIMTLGYVILAIMSVVTIPKMRACLARLEEVLNMEGEIKDPEKGAEDKNSTKRDEAVVIFDHVEFLYPGAEEPVIKDLSFSCFLGQTTAIIGGTGSGKSTVANLLLRLHDINKGQIRLMGKDIRSYSQKELRERIAYVPQKAFLFGGTIAGNLRMGKADATRDEMEEALKLSQSYDFVNRLPEGLDAPVSPGGINFSGGQKQRLAIGRAIIKKSPILVFDDSFSALDFKTDAALRKALKQEVTESAKVIVAQRITTIMDADQIIVLDDGCIVGRGSHAELMSSCAVYQDIARSQLSAKEGTVDER